MQRKPHLEYIPRCGDFTAFIVFGISVGISIIIGAILGITKSFDLLVNSVAGSSVDEWLFGGTCCGGAKPKKFAYFIILIISVVISVVIFGIGGGFFFYSRIAIPFIRSVNTYQADTEHLFKTPRVTFFTPFEITSFYIISIVPAYLMCLALVMYFFYYPMKDIFGEIRMFMKMQIMTRGIAYLVIAIFVALISFGAVFGLTMIADIGYSYDKVFPTPVNPTPTGQLFYNNNYSLSSFVSLNDIIDNNSSLSSSSSSMDYYSMNLSTLLSLLDSSLYPQQNSSSSFNNDTSFSLYSNQATSSQDSESTDDSYNNPFYATVKGTANLLIEKDKFMDAYVPMPLRVGHAFVVACYGFSAIILISKYTDNWLNEHPFVPVDLTEKRGGRKSVVKTVKPSYKCPRFFKRLFFVIFFIATGYMGYHCILLPLNFFGKCDLASICEEIIESTGALGTQFLMSAMNRISYVTMGALLQELHATYAFRGDEWLTLMVASLLYIHAHLTLGVGTHAPAEVSTDSKGRRIEKFIDKETGKVNSGPSSSIFTYNGRKEREVADSQEIEMKEK